MAAVWRAALWKKGGRTKLRDGVIRVTEQAAVQEMDGNAVHQVKNSGKIRIDAANALRKSLLPPAKAGSIGVSTQVFAHPL